MARKALHLIFEKGNNEKNEKTGDVKTAEVNGLL
jgi:hypothetical protein